MEKSPYCLMNLTRSLAYRKSFFASTPGFASPRKARMLSMSAVLQFLQQFADLEFRMIQTSQMHQRIDPVLMLDPFGQFHGLVIRVASAGAKSDADEIRVQFAQDRQRFIDVLDCFIALRRKYFERKHRFFLLEFGFYFSSASHLFFRPRTASLMIFRRRDQIGQALFRFFDASGFQSAVRIDP